MLRIYLDQFLWVGLARAAKGRAALDSFSDALHVLDSTADLGLGSFPLSLAHYLEVYTQRNPTKRYDLVRVMARISKFHTLAPMSRLLPCEIDTALHERFGVPEIVRTADPFGLGVGHALGEDVAFRYDPDWAATPDDQRRFWETLSLGGPLPGGTIPPGYEAESFKKPAADFAKLETELTATFLKEGMGSMKRSDYIEATELMDVIDVVNEACARARLSPRALYQNGKAGLSDFVESLPTRNVAVQLRKLMHDNPEVKYSRTDLGDLAHLSVAVPYCDVVVTEAKHVDWLTRAKLDLRYNTVLFSSIEQLVDMLLTRQSR